MRPGGSFLGKKNRESDAKDLAVLIKSSSTQVSGSTVSIGGSEWEYAGNMTIDANSASDTTVYVLNDGGGVADLNVEDDIVVGGTVDGVDLAGFNAAQFVTMAVNGNLDNERVLTAGDGLDLTDGGAGSTATLDLDIGANSGLTISATELVMGTPTTLTVSTSNAVSGTSHAHTITSSSNPGAAASILASTAAGLLTLVELDTDTISDKSGANLTIAPTGDVIFNPGGDDILPTTTYDLNIGSITKKYLTLHAAELWVSTLVAQDTIATIGGRLLVGPTTTLTADAAYANALENNDFESVTGDNFDNWTETVSDGNVEDEGVNVYVGSHAVKITAGASTNSLIYQDTSVTGNDSYTLAFYSRGDGTYAGRYRVVDVTNTADIITMTSTGVTGTSYARVSDSFTVPATCNTVRILFYCPSTNTGVAYFDYVYLMNSTFSVEHNEMTADTGGGTGKANHNDDGDVVYMEASGKIEFMYVIDGPNGAGPYSYGVMRNLEVTAWDNWYAGDAVFNTGTTNDGFIDIYSTDGVDSSGAGPTIVGNVRQSTTYNDWEPRFALGNMNSLYGIGANDYYGLGIGDYDSSNYLLYDTNAGFRVKGGSGNITIDSTGIHLEQGVVATNYVRWDDADDDTIFVVYGAGNLDSGNFSQGRIVSISEDQDTKLYIYASRTGAGADDAGITIATGNPVGGQDYGIMFYTTDATPDYYFQVPDGGGVGIDVVAPAAMLDIDQSSSSGAVPVLKLDQADVSEEFIRFVGTAASGVLTQSIVDEGDQASETRAGWIKVYVQDDGNQITDQAYFVPIYTLSA